MQSKSTSRYHSAYTRVLDWITHKDGEHLKLSNCHVSITRYNHLGKLSGSFFKKLNIHLSHDLAIPLQGIYLREIKHLSTTSVLEYSVHLCSKLPKKGKQSRCPSTSEWINKLWYVHTVVYWIISEKNLIFKDYPHRATTWVSVKMLYWMKEGRHEKYSLYDSWGVVILMLSLHSEALTWLVQKPSLLLLCKLPQKRNTNRLILIE